MTKIKIIYCCRDCGTRIHYVTALYGKGCCPQCANKGKNNPMYGISRFGKENGNFKGGLPGCLDCNKKLSHRHTKRCQSCNIKFLHKTGVVNSKGINNPMFGTKRPEISGKLNSSWAGGISKLGYPCYFNKELKLKIRRKYKFRCRYCGLKEKYSFRGNKQISLTVHHIDYNKENCRDDNLISLCWKCNIKANFNRDYWYAYFKYIMEE